MSSPYRFLVVLILVGTVAGNAWAGPPPVSYLQPDRFVANRGDEVKLHIESGAGRTTAATVWPADKLGWFFVRADGTQENRDTVQPADPQHNQDTSIRIAQAGVTKIGLDLKPVVSTISGNDLQTFLTQNVAGMAGSAAVRDLPGRKTVRIRREECALALVRVPAADGQPRHSAIATSKTGQVAEIQPMFDPTMLTVGSDLAVRTFLRGSGLHGAKVQATCVTSGAQVAKVTDSGSSAYFAITQPGVWRIEYHHAVQLTNDPQADWAIYSATLSFDVPATPAPAPGEAREGAGK